MGMLTSIMAFLIKSDIGDEESNFQRKKTSKMYDIKVYRANEGDF